MSILITYVIVSTLTLIIAKLRIGNISTWIIKNFDNDNEVDNDIREELIKKQIRQLDVYTSVLFALFIFFTIILIIFLLNVVLENDMLKLDFLSQKSQIIGSIFSIGFTGYSFTLFKYCNDLKKEYLTDF